jgi:hypothetical protein
MRMVDDHHWAEGVVRDAVGRRRRGSGRRGDLLRHAKPHRRRHDHASGWLTTSTDHGATFGNETHVAGSFDMLTAPNSGGFFLGDYQALGVSGSGFMPFFVAANSDTSNPTDVFTGSF